MKNIDEASKEHATRVLNGLPPVGLRNELAHSEWIERFEEIFKAGVEFAQRWIPVDEELPPCSDEDLLIKGIDSSGLDGIVDIGYMHDAQDGKPRNDLLISLAGEVITTTHWRYIDLK